MLLGPAADGALLAIGILDLNGDGPVIIHAMPLRTKFYRFLERGRRSAATSRRPVAPEGSQVSEMPPEMTGRRPDRATTANRIGKAN